AGSPRRRERADGGEYPAALMLPRDRAIQALQSEAFDLLVIGGGITGAGVALDAASRGYSVALAEKADYASGTSSRSSKLVHGGLRYLQNFDLGLVREALLERQLMVTLAPHLVRPLPLVVPAFEGARPDRLMGVGLNLYDVMSVTDRRSASERLGSVCANRVEVSGLLERDGRTRGVRVRDAETGAQLEVRAANVVNATGVWADELRPEELHGEAELPRIRPSRGTHVTLHHDD